MNGAKTLTHLLFPLFIGFIIGGAISGTTVLWVLGIILLVLDVIVGIALQRAIEQAAYRAAWERLSREEREELTAAVLERIFADIEENGRD